MKAAGFKAKAELPDIPKGDLGAARAAMRTHLQNAVAAISAKSPAEADAYKAWLMVAAKKVAEADKEGGVLRLRRHAGQRQGGVGPPGAGLDDRGARLG